MSIEVFNITHDEVISSYVGIGQTDYKFAIENICPLINRFDAQRRFLDIKFYERLERDILTGCIMPPITIAFILERKTEFTTSKQLTNFVMENISKGYILDGIQRLNTLKRVSADKKFDTKKQLFLNVIIAINKDKLLYRMITINNGQKPMTPRHQIEILTQELFDFKALGLNVQTEKEKSETPVKDAYSLGDISKGYTGFLTSNVHNENSKIIDEKMDQILVDRILNSDMSTDQIQFQEVLKFISKVSGNSFIRTWLQVTNNFIGFCVGVKKSYDFVVGQDATVIQSALDNFDKAFKAVNPSKVNVGKFRRELSKYFLENAKELFFAEEKDLIEKFSSETLSE
jgi:hypothetical protein